MTTLPDLSAPLAPGVAALVPAVAALIGALVGGLASVLAVYFTHRFTARREEAKEVRTTRAMLAVIRGEADALARLAVARRAALTAMRDQRGIQVGKDIAILAVSPLGIVSEGAGALGLLPVDVVTELFALNATVSELNRVIGGWGDKSSGEVAGIGDIDALLALFQHLLEEANDVAGLVAYKLRSPAGKALVVFGNLRRARRELRVKPNAPPESESSGNATVRKKPDQDGEKGAQKALAGHQSESDTKPPAAPP